MNISGVYVAREIDLTVTATDGAHEYTITPALIDAVARRTTDDDIDTYVDRQRGDITHRSMARDLDTSPLAAEIILQALRPVVHEHFDIEESGASVADFEDVGRDDAGDT